MRVFQLVREEDESGVSGTGVVAQGVEFDNGMVAFSWISPHIKIDIALNIKTVGKVHGHEGKTRVVWIFDTDPADTVSDEVVVPEDKTEEKPPEAPKTTEKTEDEDANP